MNPLKFSLFAPLMVLMTSCSKPPVAETKQPPATPEAFINNLVSQMTLAEKIGQMTQAERKHATPEDVKTYFLGSILNGGGSVPGNNTVEDWRQMIADYQGAAKSTRLGIPMMYGTDAVHGHNNVVGATLFPHNVGLGAARDPDLVRRIAEATAKEVVATGVHWNFAPALCVSRDKRWGRSYECFSEHPEVGESYSGPYVAGMQASGQILATAKHWVGDGGTLYGTGDHEYVIDRGDTQVDMQTLRELHVAPYLGALKQEVGTVMYSYSSVNGLKMHAHDELNNGLLKGELGFDGFAVSDWQAIEEIQGETNRERVVKAINAGLDMAMEPEFWREYITDLTAAVEAGEVSMARIDDAVKRILRQKQRLGLFERAMPDERAPDYQGVLGNPAHRKLAREAVRASQVLLKNEGALPLNKSSHIYVTGSHADDIGLQSGGWSISWQGSAGQITPGTTILDGIQQHAQQVTFKPGGEGIDGQDVAVVVLGEQPYAEGYGDYGVQPCEFCQPLTLTAAQVATLENVKASGLPMVVLLVSGRPLLINEHLEHWDALMAAWLPGSEGAGVADVLFAEHNPSATLPVSWPVRLEDINKNVGDDFTPLFPYGFGLVYP